MMRNFKPIWIPVIGSLLFAVGSFAADVRMTVEKPLISLLDRTVLRIEFIDTQGDAVDIPAVDGLQIEYQGRSTEARIDNRKSTSKQIHTYLITPAKEGDYTIGPVTCKYKGGKKQLTASLRVIKPDDDKEVQELSEIMFSRISTERDSPFVHEPFTLDLKVYLRDGLQIDGSFSLRGGIPESGLDGGLKWNVVQSERVEHEGSIFNVHTLRTTAKMLTAGTFNFQPEVQLNVVIPRQDHRPYGFNDPFFGDLFGRQETRPMVLECNKLEVAVRPIPMKQRPDSFTGGVGIFEFDVDVGPANVKAGEPVTVRMRISGRGNISQITPPQLEDDHDIKLYEVRMLPTEASDEILFEQVLIPKSDTVTEVPAISFSYFNTRTSDFRTLTRGPFPLEVEAVPQQAAQLIATVPSTVLQETKVLGRDIVYLKTAPEKWRKGGRASWHRTRRLPILITVPVLLLLVIAHRTARRATLENNVALARRQKAPKAARKNIQLAEQALRKADASAFHEALWITLTEYFGHRLNLAPGDVTLQTVLSRIPQQAEALEALFSAIEHRRYGLDTGDSSKDEMKALLRQTSSTLKKCERVKL